MMTMNGIYLDNAATTFPKPSCVTQTVIDCMCNYAANPKRGVNPMVRLANDQLNEARNVLSAHLGCNMEQLVFVPSATYGLNFILQGYPFEQGDTIYLSPFEHNGVARTVDFLRNSKGISVRQLAIDSNCRLDVGQTRRWFGAEPPRIVVLSHASNVSGDILPIKQIIDLVHEYGGKVLIDAAQTVGVYTPRMDEYNYDFLTFSSHKGLYGIPGSGGLVIKEGAAKIQPLIYGGTGNHSEGLDMPLQMPERFEAGTFSLPAIISMKAGIKWLEKNGIQNVSSRITFLCDRLVSFVDATPGVRVIGRKGQDGNSGIVSIVFDWISPQEVNTVLDIAGISVRAGLHCAPMAHNQLGTMPNGTLRVSPSFLNSKDDIDLFCNFIDGI